MNFFSFAFGTVFGGIFGFFLAVSLTNSEADSRSIRRAEEARREVVDQANIYFEKFYNLGYKRGKQSCPVRKEQYQ